MVLAVHCTGAIYEIQQGTVIYLLNFIVGPIVSCCRCARTAFWSNSSKESSRLLDDRETRRPYARTQDQPGHDGKYENWTASQA